ncbi:MAG TPA: OB-fold domain-containing protein [Croceicoccus sp.]|nr:OB-fold domain-containing protein [Croceicoccus sp.]
MDERIARHPPALGGRIVTDAWTAPFWEAAAMRELVLPCCAACGTYRMPPTPFCPNCHSQSIDWMRHAGAAVLYSYTIVDRVLIDGMEGSLPYVPAVVEFPDAQGIRLITNIVDCRIGALRVDAPVELTWIEPVPGTVLPAFTLSREKE